MLEIDMEFRKGILFVRLNGNLTKDTVPILRKEVTKIIQDYEILNVVFNLEMLKEIDREGMESLLKHYELANKIHGKTIVCGITDTDLKKRMKQGKVFQYLYETSDELTAFEQFTI